MVSINKLMVNQENLIKYYLIKISYVKYKVIKIL